MTISFIFKRNRPDAEPVKISGKPGNIVKNAHRNKKKAVKTTFPKGFSSSGNKHFRRYFPRDAQKIPMTTVFIALATVFVVMTTVFMQGELRTSEP